MEKSHEEELEAIDVEFIQRKASHENDENDENAIDFRWSGAKEDEKGIDKVNLLRV